MADYIIQDTTLTGIADAIRGKTGGTDPIPVPDMAAQIAGISGGGDSSAVQYKSKLVTLTGTWNERVSIDFGFDPDLIIVFSDKTVTLGGGNFLFMGVSSRFEEAAGSSFVRYFYLYSDRLYSNLVGRRIDDTGDANVAINSADETGFNFGVTHPSGSFYVIAIKMC